MPLWIWLKAILLLVVRVWMWPLRRHLRLVIRYDSGFRSRVPFSVPLRVSIVEGGGIEPNVVHPLLWEKPVAIKVARLPEHLRDNETAHIVILAAADFGRTVAALFKDPNSVQIPALLVVVGSNWALARQLWRLPRGTGLIAVRSSMLFGCLKGLMERIANDEPLERAIQNATEEYGDMSAPLVVLDRSSSDALRVGDAAEMTRVQYRLAGGADAEPPFSDSQKRGLVTNLWKLAAPLERATPESLPAGARLLDINVLRTTYRPDVGRIVRRGTTLARATEYFLTVHVGPRLASSAIRKEDGALSHVNGVNKHTDVLDVVVQVKELELLSRRRQQVTLRPQGASALVYFTVRTPAEPGTAHLRVLVYRRTKLLQSYWVEAEVTDHEVALEAADRGVVARMDFSFVRDLSGRPAESEDRSGINPLLSLAVNRDARATHSLFAKGAQGEYEFSIPESGVKQALDDFRRILLEASYVPAEEGEAPQPRRWSTQPGSDAKEFIRRLARLGYRMHRAYLDNTVPGLRDTLRTLRDSADQMINVTRLDTRFAFPWPVFYDMYVPKSRSAEVCFGESAPGVRCDHTGDSTAFCIRGFWGYRHQIEELIGGSTPREWVSRIKRTGSRSALRCVVDESLDSGGQLNKLLELHGADRSPVASSDALLATLSDVASRPALLMLFAHLHQCESDDLPAGPRIPLPQTQPPQQLWCDDILDHLDKHPPWIDPSALVLLLTCNSAATSPETLTDFVIALNRAQAGAIVGTECLALSDAALRFADAFLSLVWQRERPLGEAMMEARRHFLRQGNPLAFAFSCIGRADLRVEKP
jgi:hypothetical protein